MRTPNPYSKYRFDNSWQAHFRVDHDRVIDVFGTGMTALGKGAGDQLFDKWVAESLPGTKWAINHTFEASQVSEVDDPIASFGATLIKPFKL